jgi:hypothetical protein
LSGFTFRLAQKFADPLLEFQYMRLHPIAQRYLFVLGAILTLGTILHAQEKPYFVTYSTDLEEPGNLEIALKGLTASPKDANPFVSLTIELE